MTDAPFFADVADGPESGHAVWATCDDGVRVRVGLWPAKGARGTVLILPGRTEYIEKYGPSAREFAARGYAALAIDWRGQGLADRMLDDSRTGHVMHFADYQRDLAAALAVAAAQDMPRPHFMVAHSMGGCIGLRTVTETPAINAVVFSAPMWGIRINPALRPMAWAMSWTSRWIGAGHVFAPGTKPDPYPEATGFEGNQLTKDPQMYRWMQEQTVRHPELGLGGPSMRWLYEALDETRLLHGRPSPDLPCLTFLGTDERIVDVARIEDRMARWPGGRLVRIERGEHEVMMEIPQVRQRVYDETCAHFDAHP
jgi:lysophospholipase